MIEEKQLIYLNAFNLLPNIGSATLFKIDKEFKSDFKSAWKISTASFRKFQLDQDQVVSLENRNNIDPKKEFKKLEKEDVYLITYHDDTYPTRLKEISNPPFLLYIGGTRPKEEQIKIAVVGTRLLTEYGKRVTPVISHELTTAGAIIISGLATGIDTLAHKTCLDASGTTIAVIGSGLDKKSFFPQQNYDLSLKIAERGAVVSEYPLGMNATKEKFPARNRIVSGLSNGVLVVEADERSGALITARLALEQNRDVFAIPGGIFWPKSKGANGLIKQGAKAVLSAQDILEEYNIAYMNSQIEIIPETEEEKLILASFTGQPIGIENILENSGLNIGKVIATLTTMEMKGWIKNIGSDMYDLNKSSHQ